MTWKTLLVSLNETDSNQDLISAAVGLARSFGAHLTGVYVIPAAQIYPSAVLEPVPVIFEAHRDYFKRLAASVKDGFEAVAEGPEMTADLRVVDSPSPVISDTMIEQSRAADLIVVSQTDPSAESGVELDFVERVVIGAGRPVLVFPRQGSNSIIVEKIVVAWNGSRESARAVFDSLPLLKQANEALIVWADPQRNFPEGGVLPGAEIAEVLARHGISATVDPLPTSGYDVGESLLTKVRDTGAGLLVMGAYGHSRMRELILGGTTRSVLSRLTCPVLFSH